MTPTAGEKIKRWLSCWTCHGTGTHKVKQIIPSSEWTTRMRAEHILEGGYFYDLVDEPCPKGCTP